jgi:hypothetical protein
LLKIAAQLPNVIFIACSDEPEEVVRKCSYTRAMTGYDNISVACGKKFYVDISQPLWVNSIPHVYIIDKLGMVGWRGHPLDRPFIVELKREDDRVVDLRQSALNAASEILVDPSFISESSSLKEDSMS